MAQYGSIGSSSQNLSENIATGLLSIKFNWQQLEKLNKLLGSDRDNHALRSQIQTLRLDTNAKIQTIEADINRMKANLQNDDKFGRRKLSLRAGEFKGILEKYSKCQTGIGNKMKQIPLPEVNTEDKEEPEPEQQEKQQLLVDTSQLDIALLENREKRVRQLETDMVDLNTIMHNMAAMTEEQGEQILEIDRNVETSAEQVHEATTQLQQANRFTNQRRKCLVVLLIIGVIFLIIFVYLMLG